MPRELTGAAGLYDGVPYAYAAVAPAGSTVFTAGACPLDVAGEVVCPGDVAGQTRRCLANLDAALAAAGCDRADVVKTTVYVASADRDDLLAAWAEVEAAHGADGPPSTLLGVTVLGWPGQLVEIEAVAAPPG